MEEADHRDHRLLCARRVRPGHRRASKPSDELPPPHFDHLVGRRGRFIRCSVEAQPEPHGIRFDREPGPGRLEERFAWRLEPGAVLPAREATPRPGARGEKAPHPETGSPCLYVEAEWTESASR